MSTRAEDIISSQLADADDVTEVQANLSHQPLRATSDAAAAPRGVPKEKISNIPSLVVAFCASLTTGGTTYSFGLYGATLQKTLHLRESQVDTISTAFFFAGLFSFLPGLCSDRFGSRIALTTGGCLGSINLLLYWAVARQFIVVPHDLIVLLLSILGILTYLSSALVTGAVFKIITVACQGGANKGTAVGIAKGYVGLGSGLYVAIFESLRQYKETNLDFLPMAATFCIISAALPGFLFLPTKQQLSKSIVRDDATNTHFHVLYASLFLMASLIVGSSIVQLFAETTEFEVAEILQDEPVRPPKNHVSMALFLTAIWLLPIYSFFILPRKHYDQVPLDPTEGEDDPFNEATTPNDDEEVSLLLEASDHRGKTNVNNDAVVVEADQLGETELESAQIDEAEGNGVLLDKNLWDMLRSPSAMLMLWTTTILVGAGTLESNNMDKMVQALGFRPEVAPSSLAIFSVAQAAARVFTGVLSESSAQWTTVHLCMGPDVGGIPRPFFLVMAAVIGLCAHITLAVAFTQNLFVMGAALSGAAFGMVWPLMVLITGEVFGPSNIGANYMFFDGFTSAAGTFLLSKIVAQDVYEAHIPPPNQPPDNDDEPMCYGRDCYRLTHWIVAGLTVSCIITSIAMQLMTRSIYRIKLLAGRIHPHDH
ncbi:hypothetical protein ACA910_001738 [Epithemia clementina (nom. ined.)]